MTWTTPSARVPYDEEAVVGIMHPGMNLFWMKHDKKGQWWIVDTMGQPIRKIGPPLVWASFNMSLLRREEVTFSKFMEEHDGQRTRRQSSGENEARHGSVSKKGPTSRT